MKSHLKVSVDAVDALLPQTQCQECGYAACRPYANAIVNDNESIDRCPPGGVTTLLQLAALLEQNAEQYLATVTANTRAPSLAIIREDECIGCTKCIQACPVDAIVGSAKRMHTVIGSECTGCGLCVEPCPMDCIDMQPLTIPNYDPANARVRYQRRQQRLARQHATKQVKQQQAIATTMHSPQAQQTTSTSKANLQAEIAAAVARAAAKRQQTMSHKDGA